MMTLEFIEDLRMQARMDNRDPKFLVISGRYKYELLAYLNTINPKTDDAGFTRPEDVITELTGCELLQLQCVDLKTDHNDFIAVGD